VENNIAHGPSWTRYSFADWQTYSGLEANSRTNWFTQEKGDPPLSCIVYNDTKSPKAFDLGPRQYLDLNRNEVSGSVTLQPFQSIILIDNGAVGLTLHHMVPRLWERGAAADFTLTAYGAGFTHNSVVRWNGADRPTGFVSSTALTATISAADVSAVADIPVTVYDPDVTPTETPSLTFLVVESVTRVYLPVVLR
jgi:hypothetical protein